MSISDELMARYYELLLGRASPTGMHPLEAKKQLAFEIVQTYHSPAVARKTLDEWNTRFSKRDLEHADLPAFSPAQREGHYRCDSGFKCLPGSLQPAKIA